MAKVEPTTADTHLTIVEKLNKLGGRFSESGLILFDWRVILTIVIATILFAVNVGLNLNGSSAKIWNQYVQGDSSSQKVYGKARWIRFDEWCLQTPLTLNQVANGMRPSNPDIGFAKAPLLMSLPVSSFPSVIRPQFLSYFVFDFERAFSIYWNYKVYGLFLSTLFLLLILSRNNFWLALAGSFWLYFTSYIQWWFSTGMPEMIMALFIICIAVIYLIYSQKLTSIISAAIFLYLYAIVFIFLFYPPYQIPLTYMGALVIGGFVLRTKNISVIRSRLSTRVFALAGVFVVLACSLFMFYQQAKETIDVMTHTAYPGNRISSGGVIPFVQMFMGFFDVLYGEYSFPKLWGNICESSNFFLLYPFVGIGMVYDWLKRRSLDPIDLLLFAFATFLSGWIVFGYPAWLAKVTLLNRIHENRAYLAIGISSILLVINYLSRTLSKASNEPETMTGKRQSKRSSEHRKQSNTKSLNVVRHDAFSLIGVLTLVASIGISYLLCQQMNNLASSFFTNKIILLLSLAIGITGWSIIYRFWIIALLVICGSVVSSNYMINPFSVGITPILDKDLMRAVQKVKEQDPDARWLAYGSNILANYLLATGVHCINGTKFTPDLQMMRVLDPDGSNVNTYNRFAHLHVVPYQRGASVDSVVFVLDNQDAYTIFVPPRAASLRTLGIKYFMSSRTFTREDLVEFEPLSDYAINGMYLYKRRDPGTYPEKSVLSSLKKLESAAPFAVDELKSTPASTHDHFIVTGAVWDLTANQAPSAIYADVNGHTIRGNLGEQIAGQFGKRVRFQVDVPYTRLGTGFSTFRLQLVNKDGTAYWICPIPIGVTLE